MRIKNKLFLSFVFSITTTIVYSQTNFTKGYSVGYQKGYCYSQGYDCIPPIVPAAPIPNINENINNYNDGYNRGFTEGQNANKRKNNSNASSQSKNGSVKPEFGQMNLYTPDYEHLNNMYKAAQDRYNQNQANSQRSNQQNFQNQPSSNVEINHTAMLKKYQEYTETKNVENRKLRINNLFSKYNSFQEYPSNILNGLYKAKLICKENSSSLIYQFYETCDVWIVNNVIVEIEYVTYLGNRTFMIMDGFFPLDFYYPSFQERITFGNITSGKSTITTNLFNPALNETTTTKYDVLLLGYIDDFNKCQQMITKVRSTPANYQLSNATGWYKGYLSDRNVICEERDFYLENGVVKKWIGKTGLENIVDSGGKLMEGRTSVSVVRPPIYQNLPNSPLGKNMVNLYDIYFIK
jgi:hypothetical protein